MRKQWFWAKHFQPQEVAGTLEFINRFRTREERNHWVRCDMHRERARGTHPEVRRIKRRIAAGETITFPVSIE